MNNFNINDIVKYPAHLGFHNEIIGKVIGVNTNINYDFYNNPFVWVEILDIKFKIRSLVASHKLTLIKRA